MKYRRLGKSDLKVSAIGLGTGQFGAKTWGYGVIYRDKDILNVIHAAIDSGITLFDSSETYSDGLSESLLGQALREHDRDDFVILSKAAPWNLRYNNLIKAAERSLKRLNVNAIDLYLVHYPNPFVPMKETFNAMEKLVQQGKIRYFGVSNFSKVLLKRAQESLSRYKIVANQLEYNILSRRAEKGLIPYCRNQNIGLIAYSPLARGILTGKYTSDNPPKGRGRAFSIYSRKNFLKRAQPLFNVLRKIADEKSASVVQVALGWIIKDPSLIAIPAALDEIEIRENADTPNLILSNDDIDKINRAAVSVSTPFFYFNHCVIRPISWTKGAIQHIF